jgi:hypothetical protein
LISFLYLDQAGPWSFYLSFLCSWNDMYVLSCPVYWFRWGLNNFLVEAGLKLQDSRSLFSNLSLSSSWDYKSESPLQTVF